jgi:hypothetical protein
MNKLFKTILIGSVVILGAGFLFASPVSAVTDSLFVDWSVTGTDGWQPLTGAIFNEANFLPGSGVTRFIKVTNNSGQSQRIAIEAINENDGDNLASQMSLVIKQGGTTIFNNTLKKFFDQGATYLSDLSNGASTVYDLTVTFNSDANNNYQAKLLGFDILVGFEGTEGGTTPLNPGEGSGGTISGTSAGGGGGGGAPSGLTIQGEANFCISDTDTIIMWGTSYNSTSRVVYGTKSGVFDLTKPNYGYEFSTLEINNTPPISVNGVTGHMVNIIGLTPNTKYYYKVISHASPDTVGGEFSFITLSPGAKKPCCKETVNPSGEPSLIVPENGGNAGQGIAFASGEKGASNEEGTVSGDNGKELKLAENTAPVDEKSGFNPSNLLASISNFFNMGNYCNSSTLIIIILTIIYLLSRGRKETGETEKTKKRYWDLIAGAVILIILFFLLKCQLLIIPIILLVIYLFIELLKKEK